MLRIWTLIILLLSVLTYSLLAFYAVVDFPRTREQTRIDFAQASFTVEVPNTPYRVRRGLQERSHLAAGTGMLFVFPGRQVVHFWMKDTLIPLDMIWMDEHLRVIHIEKSVPPCTVSPCPTYGPVLPARYVLEINAGQADRANIHVGDKAQGISGF